MAGSADGPSRGRSVDQPRGHRPFHGETAGVRRPSAEVERPVGLFVGRDGNGRVTGRANGRIDGQHVARRLEPYFEIIPTTDVPTALAVLADRRLAFVIVDATLPDPAMIELVTRARAYQWLRDLPIICYGTAASRLAVSPLAGAAAHDIIMEPVSTDDLVTRIGRVLGPAH